MQFIRSQTLPAIAVHGCQSSRQGGSADINIGVLYIQKLTSLIAESVINSSIESERLKGFSPPSKFQCILK